MAVISGTSAKRTLIPDTGGLTLPGVVNPVLTYRPPPPPVVFDGSSVTQAQLSGGSPVPTTGQLWPRGN